MRTIELVHLTSTEDPNALQCILHDDATAHSSHFSIDAVTADELFSIMAKYRDSRYRISPAFECDEDGTYWGTVSAIHAWWLIRVPFRASDAFLDQMRTLDDISVSPHIPESISQKPRNPEINYLADDNHPPDSVSEKDTFLGLRRYIPGLDGVRAIAVLAVIVYHIHANWLPGGFLGVTLFFVLSGYLITSLLMSEWVDTGKIDLRHFWLRRIRRLLPALYSMLAVVLVYAAFFNKAHLSEWRLDALSSVLYMSNWWFIFHHVSYFERFGTPTPFGHLWSLSIEEQFYVVWPLFVVLLCAFKLKRRTLIPVILFGAVASASIMALLYKPGFDPSRVYYGTGTHAFSLLVGSALAVFVSRMRKPRHLRISRFVRSTWGMDVVGGIALVAILSCFWWMSEYANITYLGGMFLLSVTSAVLVGALIRPNSRLEQVLGWFPLRWLGRRSYGIYLWHYPVIVLTRPAIETHGVGILRAVLQIVASIVLAALSWYFVEEPIRRRFKHRVNGLEPEARTPRTPRILRWSARGGVIVATCLVVASGGFAFPTLEDGVMSKEGSQSLSPVTGIQSVYAQTGSASANHGTNPQGVLPSTSTVSKASDKSPVVSSSHRDPTTSSSLAPSPKGTPTRVQSVTSTVYSTVSHADITAVGDSVMVDIAPYLRALYPHSVVDGEVGRQMWQASAVFHSLYSHHKIHRDVVIELGTNGPFPQRELTALIKYLGPSRHIFLANTRVPRPWQDHVNHMLEATAAHYPNVTLINWYSFSAGKDEFFTPDGVHLTALGAKQYASLIQQSVRQATAP